ncbi:MAG: sugar phosphate isomerase/epimerase family protein [Actinomycetota bacterium]
MSGIRNARDLGADDFIWDYFCRSPEESMTARVFAAEKAGFDAIGIYLGAWSQMKANPSEIEIFDQALRTSGLGLANIETLRGWASPNGPSEQCLAMESSVWEIADRFECRYVQVIGDYTGTLKEAAEGFASLCDRAAEHGLLVGLEPVPEMTNIEDLPTASEIVERADRSNGGLCFDSWHLTRSTNEVSDILKVPDGKILATQWNDGPAEKVFEDYYTDTLGTRVPPGEGQFRLTEMLDAIRAVNCQAPIGLEVPSKELWAAPIDQAAEASINGMKRLMELR